MSFHKQGESFALNPTSIQSAESVLSNEDINKRFEKFAGELKKIAPKANDFTYFSTFMMTAAEACLYNDDGSLKTGRDGQPVTASWEVGGDGPESLRWKCSDSNIRPYKNNNGDIFPESELVKAHKEWIGKPLCVDHKSNSVDAIRGVILDTYYDFKSKRVIALCALDKVSYPELARKVSTGYSTSVSMGTIVEKAICAEDSCGRVARSERDFCDHMKNKTGYGEINCQLKPIELSIVVNPADPSARIRTIFASAQNIKNSTYSSNLQEKIAQMQQNLTEISNDLVELKDLPKEENLKSNENIAPVYADIEALFTELKILKSSMEQTLEDLNKKQEDIMTDRDNSMDKKGYYLGGGGVNEPTPGKVKYPADPLNEKARDGEDKQMLQTKDYGGEGDDKIKSEVRPLGERSARRKEALENAKKNLDKKGYWLGGGGVNEPTPGKVKYEIDPLRDQVREKGDKQMVGAKPFPGVGDVDGLYGDDLAIKEKLSRASLKARFIRKAGSNGRDDLANSGWQVFAKDEKGDKLIFTASVNEISAGQSDQLFDMIATKEFGGKMLEKIREVGLEKAASVYKRAQEMPGAAAPAPAAAAPVADMGAAPAATPDAEADAGGSGDPQEVAEKLAEKTRDSAAELLEAVREIGGAGPQMGELEEGIKALPQATAALLTPAAEMRRKLERMLVSAAKKSLSELKAHYSELKLISDMADSETVKNASIRGMIGTAFEEAELSLNDAEGVLRSYAKYASGVENLTARLKSAQDATDEDENNVGDGDFNMGDDDFEADGEFSPETLDEGMTDVGDDDILPDLDQDLHGDSDYEDMPATEKNPVPDMQPETQRSPKHEDADDFGMVNDGGTSGLVVELAPGQPVPPNAKVVEKAAMDLTTKEGRAAYRTKLAEHITDSVAAESIKFNPVMADANKLADGQTQLDVKPSDSLGLVETKPEVQKRMLEVARAAPKVKKEAERLNKMIVAGTVRKEDLDKLVAEGLDSEVVKYWRDFYGQADGGAEFAKLLTAAAEKAKLEEEMGTYKIKLARSYELANEMARRGLITNERAAIGRQVDESMKWNDEGFDSYKRVIAKMPVGSVKTAGLVPQVGIRETGDSHSGGDDLQAELDLAFSGRKY
jgi:hypothetical protein